MRVSERQRYTIAAGRVESAKSDNTRDLESVATQKRINHLSDDPIGAGQAIRDKYRIGNVVQFQKNIEFSKGFIDRSESALGGMQDLLIRAKELAVNMANDTNDGLARNSVSKEIKQIMDEMASLANTSYANRFVFSGFRTQTPAMSGDGKYLGDDGAIFLQVDSNDFRQVNLQARNLFEASADERAQAHFNMMDCLGILASGLQTDNKFEIQKAMDELDFQSQKVSTYQATLGAVQNGLAAAGKRLALDEELVRTDLSNVQDADVFKVSSDFQRSEQILQSTLLASNKLLQPSLLNFMQ